MTRIPTAIIDSARLTANAWGIAYIGVTRSVADWGAGGRWWATHEKGARHYSGMPTTWVASMDENGTITEIPR